MRKRRGVSLLAAAAPTACVMLAIACASKSPASSPPIDRGGTYGAEVTVTVVGPGRVSANLPGLDCPGDCFQRWVFEDRSSDAAAQGLVLTASSTLPDVQFDGWTFETTPLAVHGRGPESCNPLTRAAIAPPLDPKSSTIALPYGETDGKPPEGLEDICSELTAVPVAYAATAHFTDLGVFRVDAGPGNDILFEPAAPASTALDVGFAGTSGVLYWRYRITGGVDNGHDGIASGDPNSGNPAPFVVVSPFEYIDVFDIGVHVLFQTPNALWVIPSGATFQMYVPNAPSCTALASDADHLYCRTLTRSLLAWTNDAAGGQPIGPTVVLSNLPDGREIAVDDLYFYIVDDPGTLNGASIRRVSKTGIDAAASPPFFDLVTGLTNPTSLSVNSSYIYWIDFDGTQGTAYQSFKGSHVAAPTLIANARDDLRWLALDPSVPERAYLGAGAAFGTGTILQGLAGGAFTIKTDIASGLDGLATDGVFLYWTGRDGRVYRTSSF